MNGISINVRRGKCHLAFAHICTHLHICMRAAHIPGRVPRRAVYSENIHRADEGKVRETFLSAQAEKYELGLLLLHRLGPQLCLLRQQQNL